MNVTTGVDVGAHGTLVSQTEDVRFLGDETVAGGTGEGRVLKPRSTIITYHDLFVLLEY